MTRFVEENERVKYDYATYLRHAKGQDDKSIDKARAAIRQLEESTRFKQFKKFHRQQAADFRDYLNRQKECHDGQAACLFNGRCDFEAGQRVLSLVSEQAGIQTGRDLCRH